MFLQMQEMVVRVAQHVGDGLRGGAGALLQDRVVRLGGVVDPVRHVAGGLTVVLPVVLAEVLDHGLAVGLPGDRVRRATGQQIVGGDRVPTR